jgi:hypothetical protein
MYGFNLTSKQTVIFITLLLSSLTGYNQDNILPQMEVKGSCTIEGDEKSKTKIIHGLRIELFEDGKIVDSVIGEKKFKFEVNYGHHYMVYFNKCVYNTKSVEIITNNFTKKNWPEKPIPIQFRINLKQIVDTQTAQKQPTITYVYCPSIDMFEYFHPDKVDTSYTAPRSVFLFDEKMLLFDIEDYYNKAIAVYEFDTTICQSDPQSIECKLWYTNYDIKMGVKDSLDLEIKKVKTVNENVDPGNFYVLSIKENWVDCWDNIEPEERTILNDFHDYCSLTITLRKIDLSRLTGMIDENTVYFIVE